MALVDALVSFTILSDQRTAAWITEQLGIAPTDTLEAGESRRAGGHRYEHAGWTLDIERQDDSEPFDAALKRLIDILQPHKQQLAAIRPLCHFRLVCSGSSDSTQGGFWLSPECLAGVGWLGAEILFTVYLEDLSEGGRAGAG
jgi:hypothetical protein